MLIMWIKSIGFLEKQSLQPCSPEGWIWVNRCILDVHQFVNDWAPRSVVTKMQFLLSGMPSAQCPIPSSCHRQPLYNHEMLQNTSPIKWKGIPLNCSNVNQCPGLELGTRSSYLYVFQLKTSVWISNITRLILLRHHHTDGQTRKIGQIWKIYIYTPLVQWKKILFVFWGGNSWDTINKIRELCSFCLAQNFPCTCLIWGDLGHDPKPTVGTSLLC